MHGRNRETMHGGGGSEGWGWPAQSSPALTSHDSGFWPKYLEKSTRLAEKGWEGPKEGGGRRPRGIGEEGS